MDLSVARGRIESRPDKESDLETRFSSHICSYPLPITISVPSARRDFVRDEQRENPSFCLLLLGMQNELFNTNSPAPGNKIFWRFDRVPCLQETDVESLHFVRNDFIRRGSTHSPVRFYGISPGFGAVGSLGNPTSVHHLLTLAVEVAPAG